MTTTLDPPSNDTLAIVAYQLPENPDTRAFAIAFSTWINAAIDSGLDFETAVANVVDRIADEGLEKAAWRAFGNRIVRGCDWQAQRTARRKAAAQAAATTAATSTAEATTKTRQRKAKTTTTSTQATAAATTTATTGTAGQRKHDPRLLAEANRIWGMRYRVGHLTMTLGELRRPHLAQLINGRDRQAAGYARETDFMRSLYNQLPDDSTTLHTCLSPAEIIALRAEHEATAA